MKKTIIALLALSGMAMADSTLTLVDQWEFNGNWTSTNGKSFSGNATQVSDWGATTGIAKVRLYGGDSGWFLNDSNKFSLTRNWALQITMGVEDAAASGSALRGTGGTLFGSGSIALQTKTADETVGFKMSNEDGYVGSLDTDGTMQTYTLMNYNGNMYLATGSSWNNFVLSDDSERGYIALNEGLTNLSLGYNRAGNTSLATKENVYMYLDDIKVYTFDNSASSLDVVKTALIPVAPAPAVPEPTTATLSLLALAGLAARRRRR